MLPSMVGGNVAHLRACMRLGLEGRPREQTSVCHPRIPSLGAWLMIMMVLAERRGLVRVALMRVLLRARKFPA